MRFDVITHGIAAHSARAWMGKNAIHAIASAAATAATAHGAISHGVSRIRAYIQRDASVPYS